MSCKPKKNSLRMADGGEAVTRWAGNQLRMLDGGQVPGLIGGDRLAQQNAATAASSIVKDASQQTGAAAVAASATKPTTAWQPGQAGQGRGLVNPALANPALPPPTMGTTPLVGAPGSSQDIQFDSATRTLSNAAGRATAPMASPLTMGSAQNIGARNSLLQRTPGFTDFSKRPQDGLFMADGGEAPPTSLRGLYQGAARLFTPRAAPAPAVALAPIVPASAPAPAPAPAGISGYVGNSALARREAAAGLQDGGEAQTLEEYQDEMGGLVPGKGKGDKIAAKYEPGEFVASNDMLDDNPGLREMLHSLRAETLHARGKTVAEADAKAVKRGSLRAADGAWAPTNPFFDTFGVASRRGMHASGAIEAQADAQRALTASQNAARAQTLAADAASAAQAENAAVKAALNTASPAGAPPAPTAPAAPTAAPAVEAAPTRTGVRGAFDTVKGYAGRAGDIVKSAGPTLAAGAAGATVAHLARNIGNPGNAEGPGPAVSANVAQIPTDGHPAAPPKQAYNAFTDTEVGRNVGNLVSAASVIPGLNVMRVPLAGAQAAAMSARAAAGVAALQGAANTIRHDRAATSGPTFSAAPAAAEPQPQAQPVAQPQAQPVAPQPAMRSGFDGFTMPAGPREDAPIMAAPTIRHSGNDWQARNDLRNLAVSASSITNRPGYGFGGRAGVAPDVAAYAEAMKHDTNLKGGNTLAEVAGIKAASEANTSRNTLRSYRHTADQALKGHQVPLQVEGMKLQMQRNMMGAMQQLAAAHTDPKTGQVDTAAAANTARQAGLLSVADEFDKSSKSKQELVSKGQDMERGIYDHVRNGVKGQYNHLNTDGDVKRTEAIEAGAANGIIQMHPELRGMTPAQINERLPKFRAEQEAMQVFRDPKDYGWGGALPSFLPGVEQQRDSMTMRPGHDVLRGAEIKGKATALNRLTAPNKTTGDRMLYTPSGRNLSIPAGMSNEGLAVLQSWIDEANQSSIRAK